MSNGRRLTTDTGTAILHLIFVASFIVLLATGLRIAADDPVTSWLIVLDPILPMKEVWFWHLISGLIFLCAFAAYIAYLFRARITSRVAFDRSRLYALFRFGKAQLSAFSVAVYWGLIIFVFVEIVTGIMLFLGFGGRIGEIHLHAMWFGIATICLHIASHYAIGGSRQLMRVVRPAPLLLPPPPPDFAELLAEQLQFRQGGLVQAANAIPASGTAARSRKPLRLHPILVALLVGAGCAGLAFGLEGATRSVLRVGRIEPAAAPVLDGDLREQAWSNATPVTINTTQGGDFGGTGQSAVEVRAVHDGTYAYFAFVWTDPTRSLKHMPLIKTKSGWEIAAPEQALHGEAHYHEDKFSVLLARSTLRLIGSAIQLSAAPRRDRPASSSGRGLHYTSDESVADVWVWRASHGGLDGHIDNCHFAAAAEPTADQAVGRASYKGGFAVDPGQPTAYLSNAEAASSDANSGKVVPKRLPRNISRAMQSLGEFSSSPRESDSENARWWMTEAESYPYSAVADAPIPTGTVVPGIVSANATAMGTTSIRGVARWAAGRWTLEIARKLDTASKFDVPIETGILLWVAAFDRSDTRHTRHLRPLILEIDR